MKMNLELRTTFFVLSLLAVGCVAETSGGGTDSSSHWLDACEQDSECGGTLSCLCNVCTLKCDDASACSSLSPNAVCAQDWDSCGANFTARICAPERVDSGGTTEPSPTESTSAPSGPIEVESGVTAPSAEPVETETETESDPVDPTETTLDASTAPSETTLDASVNPSDAAPPASEALDAGPAPDETINEDDISVCSTDDECIVVDYSHCCGATKRAINLAYEDEYAVHPEWQSYFDDAQCASIGICRDDSAVTRAQCARNGDEPLGFCSLVFTDPGSTPSGEACQANAECQSNVCIRTAADNGTFGEFECGQCLNESARDFACDEDADCCAGTCCLGCGEREGLCLLE